MASVFVSYSHCQGDWVWDRFVPVLRAARVDYHIDRERFKAGHRVVGQMDTVQSRCDVHVLILSPEYLASDYCRHEMTRAVSSDPRFERGAVVPVVRVDCPMPAEIAEPNPLYVDLRDDGSAAPWDLLLAACDVVFGAAVPEWLAARDHTRRFLERRQSVNLIVSGNPPWEALLTSLRTEFPDLGRINLERGAAASRRGLVAEILKAACGVAVCVPPEPEDLVELDRVLVEREFTWLALTHFDIVARRHDRYQVDLFAALRALMTDEPRKLALLVQSRAPFATLLPRDHPLSAIDMKTVELRGKP